MTSNGQNACAITDKKKVVRVARNAWLMLVVLIYLLILETPLFISQIIVTVMWYGNKYI